MSHYSESAAQDLEQFYISEHSVTIEDTSTYSFLDDDSRFFIATSFISSQSLYFVNDVDINRGRTFSPSDRVMAYPLFISSIHLIRS